MNVTRAMLINYPAVRAASRLLQPIYASFAEAYDADHRVCPDGYGIPHLCEQEAEASGKIVAYVADRFGMDADTLWRDIYAADQEEGYLYVYRPALYPRGDRS